MQAIPDTRCEVVAQAVAPDADSARPVHVSADYSKYPYGLPRNVADRLDARTKAKLAALAVKRARYVPWHIAKAARAEQWALQAELRRTLRKRTGRKWAVVGKRTRCDADFTITFRPHWYRQPTLAARQRLATLLGKEWHRDCIRLTRAEAQAFLNGAVAS